MKVNGNLLFLGTGGSMGVPMIGCTCQVCKSKSHFNKRMRPSALCTIGTQKLLIDCGPDFRNQALKYDIKEIDGILFTHAHNDHTVGIDDLRIYCLRTGRPIPCVLSKSTAQELMSRFYYLFEEKEPYAGLLTRFAIQYLEHDKGEIVFQGVRIGYFTYEQLHMPVNGFRFGDMAYVTDIREYPENIFEQLNGVKTLVLSSLRKQATKMHFGLDEAIEFATRANVQKTWLTHIAHELDHAEGNAYLPENIRLAYDGLTIDFHVETLENFHAIGL